MRLPLPLLITTSLLLATAQADASCRYSKTITRSIPAASIQHVSLSTLAGELEVGGGGDTIEFKGLACADEQEYLDRINLAVEEDGDKVTLAVVIPYHDRDFRAEYAYMDVVVKVPKSMTVDIRDSSGDIITSNVSVTRIDDSSGDIRVADSTADLVIEDSSGDINIRHITGNVQVDDSSGEITIRQVTGDVVIPRDSSGDIEIETVSGTVRVDRDSSGEIEISHVGKGVQIGSDGSGDIDIGDIEGNVDIGAVGSGRIMIADVKGDFTLEAKGHGDVRIRNVSGKVSSPK